MSKTILSIPKSLLRDIIGILLPNSPVSDKTIFLGHSLMGPSGGGGWGEGGAASVIVQRLPLITNTSSYTSSNPSYSLLIQPRPYRAAAPVHVLQTIKHIENRPSTFDPLVIKLSSCKQERKRGLTLKPQGRPG